MEELAREPRARLEVATVSDGGQLRVRLAGDLDLAGLSDLAPQVEALLLRGPQPVLLDLDDVDFLDSSGVTLLIRLANHFGRVRTCAAGRPVRRVIDVLGLAGVLGMDGE